MVHYISFKVSSVDIEMQTKEFFNDDGRGNLVLKATTNLTKWLLTLLFFFYLIFVNFSLFQFGFTLFLKGDDNQSDENVDKEKGKDDEVNDVKNGHFHSEEWYGPLIFKCSRHTLLQNTAKKKGKKDNIKHTPTSTLSRPHTIIEVNSDQKGLADVRFEKEVPKARSRKYK